MSRASDIEAMRLEKERVENRCNNLIIALEHPDRPSGIDHIAKLLLAEATAISEARKSAWKSRSEAHTAAGRALEQWARDLAEYLKRDDPPTPPPPPNPHRDPIDLAEARANGPVFDTALLADATLEAFRDAAPTLDAVAGIDTKLNAAFATPFEVPAALLGERLSATAAKADEAAEFHITASGQHGRFGLPESQVTICGEGPPALRTYRGAANCPECIRIWEQHNVNAAASVPPRVVLLTGSRGWVDAGRIAEVLSGLKATIPGLVIRHGKCRIGADAIAAQWCVDNGVTQDPMPADWGKHPTAAGPIRNQAMIDKEPRPESYVAFWDGRSAGTNHCVGAAEGAGIKGTIYRSDSTEAPSMPIEPMAAGFIEPPAPSRKQTQQHMTFVEIRSHGQARARGVDHRSYSQVTSFAECGVRYALSDLDVPAWWNVAGTAFHYAAQFVNTEAYVRQESGMPNAVSPWSPEQLAVIWTNCFNRAISETIAEESEVPPHEWRTAKKGAEGYDYWRTEGAAMLSNWVNRLAGLLGQGWRIATIAGAPAVELSLPTTVGGVKIENILDLVLQRYDQLLIVDFKSGDSLPDSTHQLGQYGHALAGTLVPSTSTVGIYGAYWMGRTDTLNALDDGFGLDAAGRWIGSDLRDLHPLAEIEYLITTMHKAELQGLYLPHRSRFCSACGVKGLCPVGPR